MNIETRYVECEGFEVRQDDDGHYLYGMVAPFDALYDSGAYLERFAPSAFDKTIKERGGQIHLLEQHSTDRLPIGRSVKFKKKKEGLYAEFALARTLRGEEAYQLAADGFVNGLSVGFVPIRTRNDEYNGRALRTRLEVKLDHVGLVRNPAYDEARLVSVREYNPDDGDQVPRLAEWRHRFGINNDAQ